jgi:hypothetical protein
MPAQIGAGDNGNLWNGLGAIRYTKRVGAHCCTVVPISSWMVSSSTIS